MMSIELKDATIVKEISAQRLFCVNFEAQNVRCHNNFFNGLTESGARNRITLISKRV